MNEYYNGNNAPSQPYDHVAAFNRSLPYDMEMWQKQQWSRYYLRRDALLCGIMLLSILALQYLVSFVDSMLKNSFTVGETAAELLNTIYYIIYMGVPAVLAVIITRRDRRELFALGRPQRGSLLPILLICLACIPMAQLFSSVFDSLLSAVSLNTPSYIIENAFGTPTETGARILSFITTAILAAVLEEFAFRGVMLQLLRRYGNWFAIIGCAIMFGMLHSNTYQIPFAFMYGIVMGAAVVYTGSLWTSIILHFINNAMSFGVSLLSEVLKSQYIAAMGAELAEQKAAGIANAAYYGSWIIFLVLGLVGLALFAKARKNGKITLTETDYRIQPQRAAYGKLLLSPTVLTALIIFFISAMLMTELLAPYFYGAL